MHEEHEADRRDEREQREQRQSARQPVDRVVDLLAALRVLLGGARLFLDDRFERRAFADGRAGRGGEVLARKEDSRLDELTGRDVERANVDRPVVDRDVAAHGHRVPPGTADRPWALIVAVNRSSATSHSSPQSRTLTSTTSS